MLPTMRTCLSLSALLLAGCGGFFDFWAPPRNEAWFASNGKPKTREQIEQEQREAQAVSEAIKAGISPFLETACKTSNDCARGYRCVSERCEPR